MDIGTKGYIDISDLVNEVNSTGTEQLKRKIEEYQDEIVKGMIKLGYTRSGSYTRSLVTSLGKVTFKVIRLKRPGSGTISPLLDALHIRGQKYSRDVLCVDLASRLSYGDASKEISKSNDIYVPKRTIHSFVQELRC